MIITRVEVLVYHTRLRGMFATGGEVYRWFGRHVTPHIARDMRRRLATHKRTGRLARSLFSRTRGTNQYKLHVEAGATAPHAIYFIHQTSHSDAFQTMGVQSPLSRPNPRRSTGGPSVLRVNAVDLKNSDGSLWAAGGGRRGYAGNNFPDDAMVTVLRRRRLL